MYTTSFMLKHSFSITYNTLYKEGFYTMKILRGFFNCILTTIIACALCADLLFLGLSIGILNENKVYKALENNDVYDIAYDKFLEANLTNDISNVDIKDAFTKDSFKELLNNMIHYIYTSELNTIDFTDNINTLVDAYSQTVYDSFSTYLNDYFDTLKKRNYNFTSNITLGTSEEDFCINTLGINLNNYIPDLYAACNNQPQIFASIADDAKKQILDNCSQTLSSEVEKVKTELNTELNASEQNAFYTTSEEINAFSSALLLLKHNMFFLRIAATLSMVFCLIIIYLMYAHNEKYKLFSKIGIALLANIAFYSLSLYACKLGINELRTSKSDYVSVINSIYNLFAEPFIFITICCILIAVFCYVMWGILRTSSSKKSIHI